MEYIAEPLFLHYCHFSYVGSVEDEVGKRTLKKQNKRQ